MAFAILLGLLLNLDRDEWFVALTFGVLIDADHLFALPRYVSAHGWSAILAPTWDDGSGLPWRSLYHCPDGAFIVGYLAIGWRLFIPFLFWGTHVAIDEFQLATIEYSAAIESVFLTAVVVAIFAIGYIRWHELEPEDDLHGYLAHLKMRVRQFFVRQPSQVPGRGDTI